MGKRLSFLVVLCFLAVIFHAQDASDESSRSLTAAEHIAALEGNTLLVRLPSNRKKIQSIEASLSNDDLSEKGRLRLAQLLESTRQETEEMHENYIQAFRDEYSFSSFGLFFDYDTPAVLEGWGKVYQDDLVSPVDVAWDQPWYVLSLGQTPDSRLDGMVVLDHQLDVVPRPFPNNVLTSGMAAIGAWFAGGPSEHYFVRKLQKNLARFAERTR